MTNLIRVLAKYHSSGTRNIMPPAADSKWWLLSITVLLLFGFIRAEAGAVSKSSGAPPFFLQDTQDALCLAGNVFKRCAIDTLWYVTGRPPAYQIHHRPVDDVEAMDDQCLGKYEIPIGLI